ncbi:MAG: hypothetical protein ACYTDX_00235 [Planctomycetota bacterium]
MSDTRKPRHVAAVIGGAVSGAEATATLVEAGIDVVVFEQNSRPYGKIEDGLPRWHNKQRSQEYKKLDGKLDRPEVTFVPNTAVGKDVGFRELVEDWGFSAVLLANGAWKDRSPRLPGADDLVGKGFYYQNALIHWFNHHHEEGYDGPGYEIVDGGYVLGGGLASIDVCKVLMLETVAAKLRERGIEVDVVEMEHKGINKTLAAHEVAFEDLGLKGCTLIYRRTIGEMPVASARNNTPEEKERAAGVRRKLIDLAKTKYLFNVVEHRAGKEFVLEDGRVKGIVVRRTEYQDGRLVTVDDTEETLDTTLVISSIGSIPVPMEGIEMDGEFYSYTDWDTGELAGYDGVHALGNVVTGKGNIALSRKHGKLIADHVIAKYLGVDEDDVEEQPIEEATDALADKSREQAEKIAASVSKRPAITDEALASVREKVAARHSEIGYDAYGPWMDRVSPPGMRG